MAGRNSKTWPLIAAAVSVYLLAAGCGQSSYDTSGRSAAPEALGVDITGGDIARQAQAGKPTQSSSAERKAAAGASQQQRQDEEEQTQRRQQASRPKQTTTAGKSQSMKPVSEQMVRQKADVGVGRKGHYKKGLITTPLSVYWRAQERIAFQVQIPHALQLYKAMHGHYPRTKEEFEKEILIPNGIKLPELPQGHRYVYDPEKGELLVEHPAP